MTRPFATVDDYIRSFPADIQGILERVRGTIRAAAPAARETISYAMPAITLDGKELLHFAAWTRHISLYSIPAVDDALARDLAPYRAARGTLRFPLGEPIPYEVIARLVACGVDQRVVDEPRSVPRERTVTGRRGLAEVARTQGGGKQCTPSFRPAR